MGVLEDMEYWLPLFVYFIYFTYCLVRYQQFPDIMNIFNVLITARSEMCIPIPTSLTQQALLFVCCCYYYYSYDDGYFVRLLYFVWEWTRYYVCEGIVEKLKEGERERKTGRDSNNLWQGTSVRLIIITYECEYIHRQPESNRLCWIYLWTYFHVQTQTT